MRKNSGYLLLILFVAIAAIAVWRASTQGHELPKDAAIVVGVSDDHKSLTFHPLTATKSDQPSTQPSRPDVAAPQAQPEGVPKPPLQTLPIGPNLDPMVKGLQAGDIIKVTLDSKNLQIQTIEWITIPVSRDIRFWVLLASLFVVPILATVAAWGRGWRFIVGEDNRFSNSKTQAAVWFTVLIGVYVATLWLRWRVGGASFVGHVAIPNNLLLLSGLSVLTLAGAKWITTSKIENAGDKAAKQVLAASTASTAPSPGVAIAPAANTAAVATMAATAETVAKQTIKTRAADPNVVRDLTSDDNGNPDFADFQMLVVTLLATIVYLFQVTQFLGSIALIHQIALPDVDTTILAAFGLGQGAYLIKKAAT